MRKIDRWIVDHPMVAAVSVSIAAAVLNLAISVLLHPDGLRFGVGNLWLAPPLGVLAYFLLFRPISDKHRGG
ncbi:hypothetical protein GCM10027271_05840 [Saccharopolyspora gloriosae]|uniref:Uncharacterized protein n=1 Tax=Saccharopolyspora gloriosae TaxID=455344 RepID=A0A840NSJ8_9PSEU|nr:hypothetical protein [Saccharopolyspora gloriosae]MBB5072132.1 hypothetical protein [Saccharopolyspora gloriosae]